MHDGDDEATAPYGAANRTEGNTPTDPRGLPRDVSGNGGSALRPALDGSNVGPKSPGGADQNCGALPRGWERPSWGGSSNGGPQREARRSEDSNGPSFDRPIEAGGYQWHYVDGVSDDGHVAIVIIALIGNPFSPSYLRARERGLGEPHAFSALNVALYARGASIWSLTERVIRTADRAASSLSIGQSAMRWEGDRLVVDVDERSAPLGRAVKGRVTLHPEAPTKATLSLASAGDHRWWPIAPLARIEVDFGAPGVRFKGHGYCDANAGSSPLHTAFETWNWSRTRTPDGAVITYDLVDAAATKSTHAFRISRRGEIDPLDATWERPLDRTLWRLQPSARVDKGHDVRRIRSLEDGPFYARSLVETRLAGHSVVAVHESLAAHRLRAPWVRALSKLRMRRA